MSNLTIDVFPVKYILPDWIKVALLIKDNPGYLDNTLKSATEVWFG